MIDCDSVMDGRGLGNAAHPFGKLFEPVSIGTLSLPNRLVMAPMGRNFSVGGVPPGSAIPYFCRRIDGGVGLCISDAAAVDHPVASSSSTHSDFHGVALATWKQIVDGVHARGGKFMAQLWHAGLLRGKGDEGMVNPDRPSIGPSGWAIPLVHPVGWHSPITEAQQLSEPMTRADIDDVIEAFAKAAEDAKAMGCDGINIHGAHGYIIDQFFWDRMNFRDHDDYGGPDIVSRTRFAVELLTEVRRRVGPDFPIFLRWSQWKQQDYSVKLAQSPAELERFLTPLAETGIDLFDCSLRRFWEPEFEGSDMNLAGWTKKLTGKPTMAVGSVGLAKANFVEGEYMSMSDSEVGLGRLETLIAMLDRGDFDLVAVGRTLIANPDWATLIREGRFSEIKPYNNQSLMTLE